DVEDALSRGAEVEIGGDVGRDRAGEDGDAAGNAAVEDQRAAVAGDGAAGAHRHRADRLDKAVEVENAVAEDVDVGGIPDLLGDVVGEDCGCGAVADRDVAGGDRVVGAGLV